MMRNYLLTEPRVLEQTNVKVKEFVWFKHISYVCFSVSVGS